MRIVDRAGEAVVCKRPMSSYKDFPLLLVRILFFFLFFFCRFGSPDGLSLSLDKNGICFLLARGGGVGGKGKHVGCSGGR